MKSLHAVTLLATLKQQLQPQTDAEKRLVFLHNLADHLIQLIFFQLLHCRSKRTDTRQYHSVGPAYAVMISRDHTFLTQREERLFHTF